MATRRIGGTGRNDESASATSRKPDSRATASGAWPFALAIDASAPKHRKREGEPCQIDQPRFCSPNKIGLTQIARHIRLPLRARAHTHTHTHTHNQVPHTRFQENTDDGQAVCANRDHERRLGLVHRIGVGTVCNQQKDRGRASRLSALRRGERERVRRWVRNKWRQERDEHALPTGQPGCSREGAKSTTTAGASWGRRPSQAAAAAHQRRLNNGEVVAASEAKTGVWLKRCMSHATPRTTRCPPPLFARLTIDGGGKERCHLAVQSPKVAVHKRRRVWRQRSLQEGRGCCCCRRHKGW